MSKSKKPLTILMLAMINVAAICSIKNWPLTAVYGFSSIFYYLIGTLLFFIPCSLVSAELASTWPEKGGIFVWAKKAMGHKVGFLAVWLLWAENIFYYPTVLSFVAAGIAYVIKPMLAGSNVYTFIVIVIGFWFSTLINMRGMKISGWISSASVVIGTLIPGILIIGLGLSWFALDKPSKIVMNWGSFFPNVSSINDLSLLAGMLLGFAGMEMSAVHAKDVVNPKKNYPKAILLSAVIIVILSILGTLAIAIVIPENDIQLASSAIAAISIFLKSYHLGWLSPVIAALITFGAFGTVSTWTVGPVKGLLAAADSGELPPIFHKVNKHGMPVPMMLIQACIVTVSACLFLFSKNINTSFWMLIVLTSQLYIIMYAIMFISGIVLRHKYPNIERPYSIPGGKIGMWIVASIGFFAVIFCLGIGFFPPTQVATKNLFFYESFLILGILFFCAVPFVILSFKKKSWAPTLKKKS
jgi:glutamate:GABA antiporter